ncbi:MAG: hypothetical protein U1E65_00700 [Myxococcota bacterium]
MSDALHRLRARYDLVRSELLLRQSPRVTLELFHVRDINALVDRMTPEDFGPDERLPYWATAWPAATALAQAILDAAPPKGPTLELGAGLGIASLVAARAGAEVVASDYEADALLLLEANAEALGLPLARWLVDWRTARADHAEASGRFARVMGSDLVYEARNVAPLADAIQHFLAPSGEVLIADPGRPYFPALLEALAARQLQLEALPCPTGLLYRGSRDVYSRKVPGKDSDRSGA